MAKSQAKKEAICPLLSSPARVSSRGERISQILVDCVGHSCKLYRRREAVCALYEVPDVVDRVSALGAASEDALSKARGTVDGISEKVSASLRELNQTRDGIREALEGAQEEMKAGKEASEKEIKVITSKLRDAATRQDRLLTALDEEVRRLTEQARSDAANEASTAARALIARGDHRKALYKLVTARGIAGGTSELLNTLGCVYLRLKRHDEAEAALRSCIDLDANYASAHVNLGLVLCLKSMPIEAEEALREGLRLDPSSGAGWNTLGNLLFLLNRRKEAVASWLRAFEEDPGLDAASENLRRQQLLENCPYERLVADAPRAV